MIITKTPFRMSFFGGGTDMESFFREYGGAVLSTTFDKYCYVNVRHLPPFFSYATELSYAKTERVNSLEEIEHPAIRNAMKMLDMHHIRLTYEADLPARSGLGTSSSFAVGMLNAFYALKGQYASKEKLAKEAIYLERVLCAEAGGWQDQIAAAFGGFNRIDFSADGYEVRPVLLSPERKRRLNGRLMMFFTGFTRFSAEIQQLNNSRNGADKLARLQEMLALVDEAEAILTDEQADLNEFGRLLDHTWKLKRGTGAAVSTDCIDALYARGIAAGALLAKRGYVDDSYADAMVEREKLVSTYMGMGVAIPHGTSQKKGTVKKSGVVLLQYPQGVDFGDEKAYLVFGIAGVGNDHLDLLGNVCEILEDEDALEQLKTTSDMNYVLEHLQ